MPTIAEENKKILRQALDVIVGLDIPFEEISSVSASGNYNGSSGEVNGNLQIPSLMDLSNGGFRNDGLAVPLGDDTNGYVSQIGTALDLTVTFAESNDNDIAVIGYVGGVLTKWTFEGSGSSRTITIPANTERVIINRIVCGEAFWFDNSSLISCSLNLRAVETKVDNPELQMSEIEIEGYEPNDITDVIGYIGTGYPIYYTSGYPGDMAPIRTFYLGEAVEHENNIVTLKGYDATCLLDEEYIGGYFGRVDHQGLVGYSEAVDSILTNAGINHTFSGLDEIDVSWHNVGTFMLPPQSKRLIIAMGVNLFRIHKDEIDPIYGPYETFTLNYVDAGIPKLSVTSDKTKATTIEHTTRPKVLIDPSIRSVSTDTYTAAISSTTATEIDTVEMGSSTKTTFYDLTDPCVAEGSWAMTVDRGTLEILSPYKVKITGNNNIKLSGVPYHFRADVLPLTVTTGTHGVDVVIEENDLESFHMERFLERLISRSNISYEFDFRGDPKLQPRDYIRVDVDGSGNLVDMTIDTIELNHEGGGTTSTIVARKGFI